MSNPLEQIITNVEVCVPSTDAELAAARKELRRLKQVVRHARALFLDGQIDKYPTSDSGPEYKLWRLVKKENE